MNRRLRILLSVPAVVFIAIGAAWFVAPARIAPVLGLTLAEGKGLSSQVGDLGSFFLTAGTCMLFAAVKDKRFWLIPPLLLIAIAASGRVVAWAVHGASLAVDMLAVELPVCLLLYMASRESGRAPHPSQG